MKMMNKTILIITSLALSGFAFGYTKYKKGVCSSQPNMLMGVAQLNLAQEAVRKATANKGGYRAEALKAIESAINAVRKGCHYSSSSKKGKGHQQVRSQARKIRTQAQPSRVSNQQKRVNKQQRKLNNQKRKLNKQQKRSRY